MCLLGRFSTTIYMDLFPRNDTTPHDTVSQTIIWLYYRCRYIVALLESSLVENERTTDRVPFVVCFVMSWENALTLANFQQTSLKYILFAHSMCIF